MTDNLKKYEKLTVSVLPLNLYKIHHKILNKYQSVGFLTNKY